MTFIYRTSSTISHQARAPDRLGQWWPHQVKDVLHHKLWLWSAMAHSMGTVPGELGCGLGLHDIFSIWTACLTASRPKPALYCTFSLSYDFLFIISCALFPSCALLFLIFCPLRYHALPGGPLQYSGRLKASYCFTILFESQLLFHNILIVFGQLRGSRRSLSLWAWLQICSLLTAAASSLEQRLILIQSVNILSIWHFP